MTQLNDLPSIIKQIDEKLEVFIEEYDSNYPKYLLMGYKSYIEFYNSHFVHLKGNIPLTLQIDEYKNVEIIVVPKVENLVEFCGKIQETDETLLEEALKQQLY